MPSRWRHINTNTNFPYNEPFIAMFLIIKEKNKTNTQFNWERKRKVISKRSICFKFQEKEKNEKFTRSIYIFSNFKFLALFKRFEPMSHFKGSLILIVRVNVVLNRTVVVDSDWRFDNLCGSHLQSQSELYHVSWWYYTLIIDLIGQLRRNVILSSVTISPPPPPPHYPSHLPPPLPFPNRVGGKIGILGGSISSCVY